MPGTVKSGSGWTWQSDHVNISGAGAVFKCFSVSGLVETNANNVTVEDNDILVDGGLGYTAAIGMRSGSSTIIRYNELHGAASGVRTTFGIDGELYANPDSAQIIGNNIYNVDHPLQIDAGLVQGNYMHNITAQSDDHTDVIFSGGGGSLFIIKDNTLINDSASPTATIMLNTAEGIQRNRIVTGNLLAGGNYTVYGGTGDPNPGGGNVCIVDNTFSTVIYPSNAHGQASSGYYGPFAHAFSNTSGATCVEGGLSGSKVSGNVISGNVWLDGPSAGKVVEP